jgi:hypothetical protein
LRYVLRGSTPITLREHGREPPGQIFECSLTGQRHGEARTTLFIAIDALILSYPVLPCQLQRVM